MSTQVPEIMRRPGVALTVLATRGRQRAVAEEVRAAAVVLVTHVISHPIDGKTPELVVVGIAAAGCCRTYGDTMIADLPAGTRPGLPTVIQDDVFLARRAVTW